MSATLSDQLDKLAKTRKLIDIEEMALKSFRETGKFTLAIPGYQRVLYAPQSESEAISMAKEAATRYVNTPSKPFF